MAVNLQREWGNVSGAPLIFLGTVLVVGGLVWLFVHFIYKARLSASNRT